MTGSATPTSWGYFIPETDSCSWDNLHATRILQRNDGALSVNYWRTCLQQWWVVPFPNSRSISSCTMDGKGDLLFQIYLSLISSNSHQCWDLPSAWVLPLCKSHINQSMDQLSSSMRCSSEWSAAVPSDCTVWHTVAALHHGAPGQLTWLEDPPPWFCPACCFASVIVWTENKNVTTFWGKGAPQRKSWLHPWLRLTWLKDFLTSK